PAVGLSALAERRRPNGQGSSDVRVVILACPPISGAGTSSTPGEPGFGRAQGGCSHPVLLVRNWRVLRRICAHPVARILWSDQRRHSHIFGRIVLAQPGGDRTGAAYRGHHL